MAASTLVYTVNDLERLRQNFVPPWPAKSGSLVIGAGLIGAEYSNDLLQAGLQIDAVDPMPGVLGTLLPEEAAKGVQTALENAGARFHFGTTVQRIDRQGSGVVAQLNNGETVQADIVLSAIGVRANTANWRPPPGLRSSAAFAPTATAAPVIPISMLWVIAPRLTASCSTMWRR